MRGCLRAQRSDQTVTSTLITSKSRISPVTHEFSITIPRLEMLALKEGLVIGLKIATGLIELNESEFYTN